MAAAAARTKRIELLTTVLTMGWRSNPVLLAKQVAWVDLLPGGRLTAGLCLGGWPDDFYASHFRRSAKRPAFERVLTTMFGGLMPAAYARAASHGGRWVAHFGLETLEEGMTEVRDAWAEAGRSEQPRVAPAATSAWTRAPTPSPTTTSSTTTGMKVFARGPGRHNDQPEQVAADLKHLSVAGATDVVLYLSSAELEQIELLADAARSFIPAVDRG